MTAWEHVDIKRYSYYTRSFASRIVINSNVRPTFYERFLLASVLQC